MWVLLCPILFNSHPWALRCHCWSKTKYPLYFEKWQLNESHKCDMEWWDNFFGSVTDNPNSLPEIKTFKLPKISFATTKVNIGRCFLCWEMLVSEMWMLQLQRNPMLGSASVPLTKEKWSLSLCKKNRSTKSWSRNVYCHEFKTVSTTICKKCICIYS